uniref:Prolactin releasing hormone n=1 Tax=Gadus morhua TaxID=8049 RepID=A0A8C5FLY6_GADMO
MSALAVVLCVWLLFPGVEPEIDPYWYTGRGIRPVGRFGRRVKARRPHVHLARKPPLPPCKLRRSPSAACTHHWLFQ